MLVGVTVAGLFVRIVLRWAAKSRMQHGCPGPVRIPVPQPTLVSPRAGEKVFPRPPPLHCKKKARRSPRLALVTVRTEVERGVAAGPFRQSPGTPSRSD